MYLVPTALFTILYVEELKSQEWAITGVIYHRIKLEIILAF